MSSLNSKAAIVPGTHRAASILITMSPIPPGVIRPIYIENILSTRLRYALTNPVCFLWKSTIFHYRRKRQNFLRNGRRFKHELVIFRTPSYQIQLFSSICRAKVQRKRKASVENNFYWCWLWQPRTILKTEIIKYLWKYKCILVLPYQILEK